MRTNLWNLLVCVNYLPRETALLGIYPTILSWLVVFCLFMCFASWVPKLKQKNKIYHHYNNYRDI